MNIYSMTGFALSRVQKENYDASVEIKGVNHRFFEPNVRAPRGYPYVESAVKSLLKKKVSRGKIDVYITLENTAPKAININIEAANNYMNALTQLSEKLGLRNDLSVTSLMQIGDIFNAETQADNQQEISDLFIQAAEQAIEKFVAMRKSEGEALKHDMEKNLDSLKRLAQEIQGLCRERTAQYFDKLSFRLKDILRDRSIDENRVLLEAAIFAEKSDINEELVRLNSHISQFYKILSGGGNVGKTLDFICQEINREVNTIGAKAPDADISKIVIAMKSDLEKLREQSQNIE